MTTSNERLSLAVAAKIHHQSCCYTDSRIAQLHAQVNSVQAALHKQAESEERRKVRVRLIDRLVFLVLGSITGYAIGKFGLVGIAALFAGIMPDASRELFEFFKRL